MGHPRPFEERQIAGVYNGLGRFTPIGYPVRVGCPPRGVRGFALASHRRRRPDAPAAPPRRHRGGRRDRGRRLHRPVDRVLPARDRPGAADRDRRGEFAGFGASGRNGGWCSALFPPGVERDRRAARARGRGRGCGARCTRRSSRWAAWPSARASTPTTRSGGTISLAAQRGAARPRARAVEEERRLRAGEGPSCCRRRRPRTSRRATRVLGATYTPALRRRASAEAGARARGAGRGARRLALRAHAARPAWAGRV